MQWTDAVDDVGAIVHRSIVPASHRATASSEARGATKNGKLNRPAGRGAALQGNGAIVSRMHRSEMDAKWEPRITNL